MSSAHVQTPDAALAAFAVAQHGVFSRAQARSVGLSGQNLAHREDRGRIRRVSRSVFVIAGAPASFEQQVMAACLAIDGAVASHESAAHIQRTLPLPERRVAITVPIHGTARLPGVHVHRTSMMPDRHRCVVNGIPVTSIERTVIDLARVVSQPRMIQMMDDLVARRRVLVGSLIDDFELLSASGRHGASMLRPLLQARAEGLVVGASELEQRFSALVTNAGLGTPDSQWHPPWGGSLIGRVDFGYVEERIIVEVDGRQWHTRAGDFDIDHRRDQLAVMAGWRVLRFTWHQVIERPAEVVATLDAVLGAS